MKIELDVPDDANGADMIKEMYGDLHLNIELINRCPKHKLTLIVAVEEGSVREMDCLSKLMDQILVLLMQDHAVPDTPKMSLRKFLDSIIPKGGSSEN